MLPRRELIDALLESSGLSGVAWRAEPLGERGHINAHALLTLNDQEPAFVVRWYRWPWDEPSPIDRLEKEVWLHELLLEADVPVARIHGWVRSKDGDALLMEHVPGVLLGELPRESAASAWRHAGESLRRVHDLRPPEDVAGRLKGGGVVPFEQGSWARWNEFVVRFHAEAAARANPAAGIEPDECVRVVRRAAALLDARPIRVIHGDANPWNVMVSGDRVVWLDWEFAQAGDPQWDLMRMSFHHHRRIGTIPNGFFEGYASGPDDPAFSIYALGHMLWMAHDPSSKAWEMACVDAAHEYITRLPEHLNHIERNLIA